ncbi:hypothetical protein G884_00796 [Escherichia coli KOEGE 40 (102a)]|nr:hypothetical protein G884_00796 [Escherichia coli KOEGE 40 (102a)]ERB04878.1 hypothetical protein G879_03028 [Escherichia coli KOEGE 7 (16a)]
MNSGAGLGNFQLPTNLISIKNSSAIYCQDPEVDPYFLF